MIDIDMYIWKTFNNLKRLQWMCFVCIILVETCRPLFVFADIYICSPDFVYTV